MQPELIQGREARLPLHRTGREGPRLQGMFKLDQSMPQARELATTDPDRFEVGSTGWVTTRFTAEEPLPKKVWETWLDESYALADRS
jgi:hypothetical protein